MRDWKKEFVMLGLTQEVVSLQSGVSAGRLSMICRKLVQATPDEAEQLDAVIQRAKAEGYSGVLRRIEGETGIRVKRSVGLSTKDYVLFSLLLNITDALRDLNEIVKPVPVESVGDKAHV